MSNIVLVGGNEFRPNCVAMDTQILRLVPRVPPRVLIVPTAAAHERPELAVQNGVRHFAALGAVTTGLMALERAEWEGDAHLRALDEADLIYFTGGNPRYLFQTIRETPLLAAILQCNVTGTILAGSSAGAMVLGGWMRERAGGWARGLGVVPNVAVIPHYQSSGQLAARALRSNLPDDVALFAIGEATGCIAGDEDRWEVIGENTVQVIEPTGLQDYRNGNSFVLH